MKKFLLFFLLSLNLNAQAPNIVYILVDDLGYGDLSSYGASDINSPAIDKLAKEGKLFTRAYANSTVCSPSRARFKTLLDKKMWACSYDGTSR